MSAGGDTERAPEASVHESSTAAPPEPTSSGAAISGPAGWILHLQRTVGNAAVQSLLASAQAKLEVGAADDTYEREADAVARRVVEALQRGQREPGAGDDATPAPRIQRRPNVDAGGGPVDSRTEQEVESARRGGGVPVPEPMRRDMESAFGTDFDGVRLHAGADAAELSQRIQAKAFTIGSDIFFQGGIPDVSPRGHELLAHELTHTIQQTGRLDRTIQRLGGGYYVVCRPDAEGAALIANDTATPKRYYRTIVSLSPQATKAEKQPFRVWTLYDDPAAERLATVPIPTEPTTPVATEPEEPEEAVEAEAVATPTEGAATGTGSKGRRGRRKKKPAATVPTPTAPTTPVTPEPTAEHEEEDEPEPAWKTKYRATTTLTGPTLEANLDYLEKELGKKTKALEKALKALGDNWIPELEKATGSPTKDDRIAALRSDMPTWDGDFKTNTKAFNAIDGHVTKVKAEADAVGSLTTLKTTIGAPGLEDMLSVFKPTEITAYVTKVGGPARLNTLLATKGVGANALKHYGAAMMATFIGAGETSWEHVVSASLNSKGVISGAHDEAIFTSFLGTSGYKLSGPAVTRAPVYKVTYADVGGTVKGSKTLIQNLTTNKVTWQGKFNEAIWGAIKAMTFPTGSGDFFGSDVAGRRYGGFFTSGRKEVDTVFPT